MGKLPKNVGWSLGTELRESHYVLSAKNGNKIQKDMIFHVCLGVPSKTIPGILCGAEAAIKTDTPRHCLGQQAGCKHSAG